MSSLKKFCRELWQHRALLWDMAKRDLTNRYAGSYLGFFWAAVVPLLSSAVYLLVFSMLMRGGLEGRYKHVDFITYYFAGFSAWLLFSETTIRNIGIVRSNTSLITKIAFPNQLLPLSIFLSNLFSHLVLVLLAYGVAFFKGVPLSGRPWLIIPSFVALTLLTLGVSFFVAAVAVFVQDLTEIFPIFLNLMFFATPILYAPETIAAFNNGLLDVVLLRLNPFLFVVEGYRMAIFDVPGEINYMQMLYSLLSGCGLSFVGVLVFKKLKSSFADVL